MLKFLNLVYVCYCVLLCLALGLCSYIIVLMFKSVMMFLCVLVQNELDLILCIYCF